MNYNPTSDTTPNPELLVALTDKYCQRWVPVVEALPPQRMGVVVMVRGDDGPAIGWLKFSAGDRRCPYFVVPQGAAIQPRLGEDDSGRRDVTHWWSPDPDGLPWKPDDYKKAPWGLGGCGWETAEKALNPRRQS